MRSKWIYGLLLFITGCQTAHVQQPLTSKLAGADPHSQTEFWAQLAVQPLTCNDEGFHAIILFMDGKDPSANYDARVAALKARKLLPDNFNAPADVAMERGTFAYTLVKAINVPQGVTLSIFGDSPRYATRALQYQGIFPIGSPNQALSGADFVGILGKAEDYQRGLASVNVPAALLPDEAGKVSVNNEPIKTVFATIHGPIPIVGDPVIEDQLEEAAALMDAPILLTLAPDLPGPQQNAPTPMKVIITGVEGDTAEVRKNDKDAWQPAKAGMVVGPEAEFRTGPHSAIRFIIPPKQTFTLDRQGTLKVLEAMQTDKKVDTNVAMPYGRVRYDLEDIKPNAAGPVDISKLPLEEAGVEHESTLKSPNSTLAVRGTEVILFDQTPFVPEALSLTGRAFYRNAHNQLIGFGNKGQGLTKIASNKSGAVESSLSASILDPSIALARTPVEEALVATVISRGATVSVNRGTGLEILHGGTPPTDQQLIPVLPGRLDFVLRWNGNANLDLSVINQSGSGEFLVPAPGTNFTRSGGRMNWDHQGGPHGGIEIAFWGKNAPDGFYSLGVNHISGAVATATIEGFRDGRPITLYDPAANQGNGGLTTVFHTTVGGKNGNQDAVIAPINVPPPPILPGAEKKKR